MLSHTSFLSFLQAFYFLFFYFLAFHFTHVKAIVINSVTEFQKITLYGHACLKQLPFCGADDIRKAINQQFKSIYM